MEAALRKKGKLESRYPRQELGEGQRALKECKGSNSVFWGIPWTTHGKRCCFSNSRPGQPWSTGRHRPAASGRA